MLCYYVLYHTIPLVPRVRCIVNIIIIIIISIITININMFIAIIISFIIIMILYSAGEKRVSGQGGSMVPSRREQTVSTARCNRFGLVHLQLYQSKSY